MPMNHYCNFTHSKGAKVADVSCGYRHSTLLLAEPYPTSHFYGFDFHEPSIKQAKQLGKEKGLNNVTFGIAKAKDFPGESYDLVTFYDCLHDMGDPAGAAKHVYRQLDKDGTWMIVEPFAHETLEQNLNPVSRIYFSFSATVCAPSSLSQEVGLALGAHADEKKLREVETA